MYKKFILVFIAMMLTGAAAAYADGGPVAVQNGDELCPEDLENAFSREETVILTEDFNLGDTVRIENTQSMASLDLNGHVLTFAPETDGGGTLIPALRIEAETKLRIFDSKGGGGIVSEKENTAAVQCGETEYGDSALVIDSGNFAAKNIIFAVRNAAVTINGGSFDGTLICGEDIGDAAISVNGGSFSQSVAEYLSDEYIQTASDGKYTIKPLFKAAATSAEISGKALEKVKKAVEKQKLCENITSIKGDMFEISDMQGISFIRASYPLSGAKTDKLNFDFDAESMENSGSVRFMVLFCNVPDKIIIGDAVVWAAR